MADVNNDGNLDIYISCTGPERTPAARRANRLYINNGNGSFTEAAARYGIADSGFTIQSVFLDYNRDGYLDLFVMNNSPHEFARGEAEINPSGVPSKATGSYDQLYRNNGDGTFTNVSKELLSVCVNGAPTWYRAALVRASVKRGAYSRRRASARRPDTAAGATAGGLL